MNSESLEQGYGASSSLQGRANGRSLIGILSCAADSGSNLRQLKSLLLGSLALTLLFSTISLYRLGLYEPVAGRPPHPLQMLELLLSISAVFGVWLMGSNAVGDGGPSPFVFRSSRAAPRCLSLLTKMSRPTWRSSS
jgi:hypothetical protein